MESILTTIIVTSISSGLFGAIVTILAGRKVTQAQLETYIQATYSKIIADLELRISNLKAEVVDMEKKISKFKQQEEHNNLKKLELLNHIKELEHENEDLRKRCLALEESNTDLIKKCDSMQAEITDLKLSLSDEKPKKQLPSKRAARP